MNVLFLLGEQHINMERVVKHLVVLNEWTSSAKIIYLNTCMQMFMTNSSERHVWPSSGNLKVSN